jgi:hypothetical protein
MDDGLKHRPRAEWSIGYMNCELNDAEIWLQTALQEDPSREVSCFSPLCIGYDFNIKKIYKYGPGPTSSLLEMKFCSW